MTALRTPAGRAPARDRPRRCPRGRAPAVVDDVVEGREELAQVGERTKALELHQAAPRDPQHLQPVQRGAEVAQRRDVRVAQPELLERGEPAAKVAERLLRRVRGHLEVAHGLEFVPPGKPAQRRVGEELLRHHAEELHPPNDHPAMQ
eukprot:scaffold101623_cov48-Phaeocystis_antarctica.AAC.2